MVGSAILLLLFFIILGSSSKNNSYTSPSSSVNSDTNSTSNNPSPNTTNVSSTQFIYFAKTTLISPDAPPTIELYTADSSGNDIIKRGTLTDFVKQVTPKDPLTFYYIGNPGFLERGDGIYLFSVKDNKKVKIISASAGFGIESLLFIKEINSIVFWEMTMGATSEGTSQIVYQSINKSTDRKVLLSEFLSDEIKYPLFYSNSTNLLYLDSYSGRRKGKNRGIFTLSLDGKVSPLPGMSLNQYSTQPALSADGKMLAFTSYNPDNSIKIASPKLKNDILRESVRNPNQIKLYDLTSGKITLIKSGDDGNLFDNLGFSSDQKYIIFRNLIIQNGKSVPLSYHQLSLDGKSQNSYGDNPNASYLWSTSPIESLFGMHSLMVDSLGGSIGKYSQIFSSIYLFNSQTNSFTKILSDGPLQILAIE